MFATPSEFCYQGEKKSWAAAGDLEQGSPYKERIVVPLRNLAADQRKRFGHRAAGAHNKLYLGAARQACVWVKSLLAATSQRLQRVVRHHPAGSGERGNSQEEGIPRGVCMTRRWRSAELRGVSASTAPKSSSSLCFLLYYSYRVHFACGLQMLGVVLWGTQSMHALTGQKIYVSRLHLKQLGR